MFLSGITPISAQSWRFPDCGDLEVTQLNFIDNDTLTTLIYNNCDTCAIHAYTGIEVYGTNDMLLARSFHPSTESSPDNKTDKIYELLILQAFNLGDIERIRMDRICDSMSINENVLNIEGNNSTETYVRIYPNPANEFIDIFISTTIMILDITIIDINGRTVKIIKDDFSELEISDLSMGVYFVIFRTIDGLITKKLYSTEQ